MMDFDGFRATLSAAALPSGLSPALEALWLDGKGDWLAAHNRLQSGTDDASSWVHAYLHRKEGDASNAAYWYRRAGRPVPDMTLDEEWADIAQILLNDQQPAMQ